MLNKSRLEALKINNNNNKVAVNLVFRIQNLIHQQSIVETTEEERAMNSFRFQKDRKCNSTDENYLNYWLYACKL